MKFSLHNLFGYMSHNKKRSFLSILGVAVGVMSLVVMSGVSGGMRQSVQDEIGKLGSRLVVLAPGDFRTMGGRTMQMNFSATLKPSDAQALTNLLQNVQDATPVITIQTTVYSSALSTSAQIQGSLPQTEILLDFHPRCGRFVSTQDEEEYAAVAVIGSKIADDLFGGECAIGQLLRLGSNTDFKIIGVMEEKGSTAGGSNLDETIFVPFATAQKRLVNNDYIHAVAMLAKDEGSVKKLMEEAEELMLERHGKKDFSLMRYEELAVAGNETLNIFSNLSRIVAGIAFAVGALGIAAIMTLSVYERIVEIGIRRAFGATKRDIFIQFLAESLTLSLIGSIFGAGVSLVLVVVIQKLAGWAFYLPLGITVISIVLSAFIGLLAGVYPAWRAVEFEPKTILQSE